MSVISFTFCIFKSTNFQKKWPKIKSQSLMNIYFFTEKFVVENQNNVCNYCKVKAIAFYVLTIFHMAPNQTDSFSRDINWLIRTIYFISIAYKSVSNTFISFILIKWVMEIAVAYIIMTFTKGFPYLLQLFKNLIMHQ